MEFSVAISMCTGLLLLCLQAFVTIKQHTVEEKDLQLLQLEAVEFIQYLEREASCTDQFYINGSRLYFYHGTDRFSYKLANRSIIRELNGEGFITVCYDVDKLNFVKNEKGLQVQLNLAKGKQAWSIDSFIPYHLAEVSP